MRNKLGQFTKGHKETLEEKRKRTLSMIDSWKNRDDYLGDIKYTPIYNIWRSFMFTKKGKSSGVSDEWKSFKQFFSDMSGSYEKGFRLGRIDKNKPFCKDNCLWMTDAQLALTKTNAIKIEYNGELRTLQEWANIYNVSIVPLRIRYHRGWSVEHILFGKQRKIKSKIKDYSEHSFQGKKDKVSKMISAYRATDKKKGLTTDLDKDWFYENIITRSCTYCGSTQNIGCDRVDNKKGHTKDNVLPACYICNVTRHDNFSVEEMKLLGNIIKKIIKNRN